MKIGIVISITKINWSLYANMNFLSLKSTNWAFSPPISRPNLLIAMRKPPIKVSSNFFSTLDHDNRQRPEKELIM